MEPRFRKYLTIRLPGSARNDHTSENGPASASPATTSFKMPSFPLSPLRKAKTPEIQPDIDGLAMRSFSYESTIAGPPPRIGGRPIGGNGPVKLQTSRRLSSGELMITTQDPQRTLADIREGDYIVGKKEKRLSNNLQQLKSSPLILNNLSMPDVSRPKSSRTITPRTPRFNDVIIPDLPAAGSTSHTQLHSESSGLIDTVEDNAEQPERPTSQSSHIQDLEVRKSPLHSNSQFSPRTSSRPSSYRTSLLTRGEEQNATISALWRAEYTRLVAIYGQDGVDRNIAELNRQTATSPVQPHHETFMPVRTSLTLEPLPKPSLDATRSPRDSYMSAAASSEHSSHRNPSILSIEESSSSYTQRTSLNDPEMPTTREDLRRIVQDMRTTYLQAIETRAAEKERAAVKKKRKVKARSSLTNLKVGSASKGEKKPRTSWHALATTSDSADSKKPTKKKKAKKPVVDTMMTQLNSSSSKSSLKSTGVQRADSLTLGTIVPDVPKIAEKNKAKSTSRQPSSSPGKSNEAAEDVPPDHDSEARPGTNDTQTSNDPNLAPDIDNQDIFYPSDRHLPATASIPRVILATQATSTYQADDAAPPPPSILWAPRKATAVAA